MSLPIPDPITRINRMLEFYKKRHDGAEYVLDMTLCEQMVLDLEEIRNDIKNILKIEVK